MKEIYREIKRQIQEYDEISIVSHINPDGDNIGSILGLGAALNKIGKAVNLIKIDKIPKNLRFLPNVEEIKEIANQPKLLFVLDCSDEDRLGDKGKSILKAEFVINIDHHKSNTMFGDINLVDSKMSSTGEILYDLIEYLGIELDNDIASPIYTAISSDTGSFKYESTSPDTLRKAANLLEYIDDKVAITKNLYQSKTMKGMQALKLVLNSIETYEDLSIIIGMISYEEMEEIGAETDDTEEIVTYINGIEGFDVAIFLKEVEKGIVRVSSRSKEFFDVSKLCEKFGGGGHKRAAGAVIEGDLKFAKAAILSAYKELLDERCP